MASETVDPIDWSHPPPTWAVPPERLVHSINRCSSVTAGIERATLQPSACEATTLPMRPLRVLNLQHCQVRSMVLWERAEINQLLFADDTALVADSQKLCRLVRESGRVCKRRQLRVYVGKSKVTRCSRYGNGSLMHVILNG